MNEISAALEGSLLAVWLRGSMWAYPLANAGHILGVSLLVGGIVPLDLRMLGLWQSIPLAPLQRILTRTAAAGLTLAVVCGLLLFITRATEYVQSAWFITKMIMICIGLTNVLAMKIMSLDARASLFQPAAPLPLRFRLSALVSLVIWMTALLLGRMVGYF